MYVQVINAPCHELQGFQVQAKVHSAQIRVLRKRGLGDNHVDSDVRDNQRHGEVGVFGFMSR